MRRRDLVLGAGAVVAVAAGIGTRLVRSRDAAVATAASPQDPWTMSFATPDGAPVRLAAFRGRPLLLNFWATWCAPCATEMPLLDRFSQSASARQWGVLALAVDDSEPVRRFLADRQLRLPVAMAGSDGLDLSRSLGNSAGALPYTVVFDRAGNAVANRLGILDGAMLDRWATTVV